MGIIRRRSPGGRDILETFYTATLLDIVCEISTGAELHYEVYVPLCTLYMPTATVRHACHLGHCKISDTHNHIQQSSDMSMGEALEDLYFPL